MKQWYKSKTIIKALIKLVFAIAGSVFGISVDIPEATIISLVGGVDGLIDVWLRFKTNQKIAVHNISNAKSGSGSSEGRIIFDPLDDYDKF